jgi:serine/threonine protein kinase/Tol biopolymer transport system component
MTLAPGSRLGVYEVTALLGRGGMGAVYRAHDQRLDRDVAIKVLPESLDADSERAGRFEREARVLASLNHPHIGAVYGLEETDGPEHSRIRALVLELVDGPTLSGRLGAGPLPVSEALRIGRQIADALEAAHERGIVHRDLKPANVKLTAEGSAKVLDFGLAKLVEREADRGQSSTVTGTHAGLILGTPRYMSPEQARGHEIDKRTDIWSFGCVLYEMLTGRSTFRGDSVSDSIAATLTLDPDWRALPEPTPASIRTLLRRCLEKDPRQRLRDIGDARIELDAAIATLNVASSEPARSLEPGLTRRRPPWQRRLALAAAAVALVALTYTAATWLRVRSTSPAAVMHVSALLPSGVSVTRGPGRLLSLALSPNGRTLVIAGSDAKGQRLYVRTLDRPQVRPLDGTEGGATPFFSPDGTWIGFFADRRLKRIPAGGGPPVEICATVGGYPAGASWSADDRIVFATGYLSPIWAVKAAGGTPEALTTPTAGRGHSLPEILPDGRTLLFNEGPSIQAVDLMTGRRATLIRGTAPRFVASGHLILNRGRTVLAVPFDPSRLELTGPAVPVFENATVAGASGGAAHLAVSPAGTLAYMPAPRSYSLTIVEPDGSERVLSEQVLLENPQFSPDGKRLVVAATARASETPELWIHDLEQTTPASRLTTDGGRAPVWSPDGASITYSRPTSEGMGIYNRSADGRGAARQILSLSRFHWLVGWTAQQTLVYAMMEEAATDGVSRSSILTLEGQQSRRVVGPGDTWGGRLSPDGRWLAYYSLDTGNFEIYVTPFPNTGGRQLIAEGTDPVWSPDGSEIYYRSGVRLMAARVDRTSGVRVLSHRLVIEPFTPPLYDDYTIHPNGRTLALVRPAGEAFGREITLVLNWAGELRRPTR